MMDAYFTNLEMCSMWCDVHVLYYRERAVIITILKQHNVDMMLDVDSVITWRFRKLIGVGMLTIASIYRGCGACGQTKRIKRKSWRIITYSTS